MADQELFVRKDIYPQVELGPNLGVISSQRHHLLSYSVMT